MLVTPMLPCFQSVAPHAGAWIEITVLPIGRHPMPVAPHAGAWIEILRRRARSAESCVAPHAGAWIEIPPQREIEEELRRRAPRGRVD